MIERATSQTAERDNEHLTRLFLGQHAERATSFVQSASSVRTVSYFHTGSIMRWTQLRTLTRLETLK